jgi:hypothetical protein
MLVDVKQFLPDQLAILTASIYDDRPENGRCKWPRPIGPGQYEIGHFSLDLWMRNIIVDKYPEWKEKISTRRRPDCELWHIGVVDFPEQLLKLAPFLETDERQFVISFTLIDGEKQPAYGGWRWKKWGPYIGNFSPTTEFIYDEPEIEKVYVYHIYEVDQ